MIKLKLLKDDKVIIYLTDSTIKNIKFKSNKVNKISFIPLMNDIDIVISVENMNINGMYKQEMDDIDGTPLPREIDSVIDLYHFALAPDNGDFCYLQGKIEIVDGWTQHISEFSFDNLFVLKYEERFVKDMKCTEIHVVLRERV